MRSPASLDEIAGKAFVLVFTALPAVPLVSVGLWLILRGAS